MDFTGIHILFCDHDPSTGSETLSLLQRCSYKVTAVKNAHEVVNTLKSGDLHVDIVLTDVELPQEKGFKMLKHILRQENLGHIAVVVMSEHDEMAVVAKCLHLGAADYLVKPLRLNEVMNLWTHMWRRRRAMGLPDKQQGITSMLLSQNFQKLGKTADLLSGYKDTESPVSPTDARCRDQFNEDTSPQLELSLRLSLNYMTEHSHASSPSGSSPAVGRTSHSSAFPAYLRPCSLQFDEQSGTNICSPPSKKSRYSSECIIVGNQESLGGVPADASISSSSPKDVPAADEPRPADLDSQLCERPKSADQVYLQCLNRDGTIAQKGQISAAHGQGLQPCYVFTGSSSVSVHQGVAANMQEATTSGYNIAVNQAHMQQLPPYCPSNVFSYYPVAHLAVPVVNFSTWPALITQAPMVGGKLIQAERREAALSKFRLKRKGRCFEKKIRYASRKKLAEQRPRVRGQFVKRSVLADITGMQAASDEEGEADDEQGCSELDNHSSPDCIVGNGSAG